MLKTTGSGADEVEMQPQTTKPESDDELVLELLYSTFSSFALLTAHKLRMFGLFEAEPLTTSEVARRLDIAERPAEILLITLTAQRLLSRTDDRYSLLPVARRYFLESSPAYLGGMLDFAVATHPMCTVENLEGCTRSDRPLAYGRGEMFQTHAQEVARARFFTHAMHSQSVAPSMAWPKSIDLSGYKKMLDVAGGSRAHSIGALLPVAGTDIVGTRNGAGMRACA